MFRFPKSERITSQKEIDLLFQRGNNHTAQAFPLCAVFRAYPVGAVSVPARELAEPVGAGFRRPQNHRFSEALFIPARELTEPVGAGFNARPPMIEPVEADLRHPKNHRFSGTPFVPARPVIKILVSVSKKRFRHAVDRNRAKRQIREAYRLNHQSLTLKAEAAGMCIDIAFIWLSREPQSSDKVFGAMQRLLSSIERRIEKS